MTALADPTRRRILETISRGEATVGDIVSTLSLPQPTVSRHLRVLRVCELVEVRAEAQLRWYRLHRAPLLEVEDWVHALLQGWSDRLDALERHLDSTAHDTTGSED